jgi:Fur family zinc uptake transcriptional regulator
MGIRGEVMQEEVLAVLGRNHGALSAYEVLKQLRPSYPSIAPTTIYRALAALTERGQVHRLESQNAFIRCKCDQHDQAAILSICNDCGTVEETVAPAITTELSSLSEKSGFAASRHVIEVHGVCASCCEQDVSE